MNEIESATVSVIDHDVYATVAGRPAEVASIVRVVRESLSRGVAHEGWWSNFHDGWGLGGIGA